MHRSSYAFGCCGPVAFLCCLLLESDLPIAMSHTKSPLQPDTAATLAHVMNCNSCPVICFLESACTVPVWRAELCSAEPEDGGVTSQHTDLLMGVKFLNWNSKYGACSIVDLVCICAESSQAAALLCSLQHTILQQVDVRPTFMVSMLSNHAWLKNWVQDYSHQSSPCPCFALWSRQPYMRLGYFDRCCKILDWRNNVLQILHQQIQNYVEPEDTAFKYKCCDLSLNRRQQFSFSNTKSNVTAKLVQQHNTLQFNGQVSLKQILRHSDLNHLIQNPISVRRSSRTQQQG